MRRTRPRSPKDCEKLEDWPQLGSRAPGGGLQEAAALRTVENAGTTPPSDHRGKHQRQPRWIVCTGAAPGLRETRYPNGNQGPEKEKRLTVGAGGAEKQVDRNRCPPPEEKE
ncbi:hypothetical protein NDU88_008123 [Pleurodeles waltl]|uniref:Uncharacterized protein n=1 Tax=Pleurodeles waltl TaxID=8319 RepID=A0AAV7NV43_PLEWA|nr:hypothetical protein NDU88_008123 [Pleurodeles waltl]